MKISELNDLIDEAVNPIGGDPKIKGPDLNALLKTLTDELLDGQQVAAAALGRKADLDATGTVPASQLPVPPPALLAAPSLAALPPHGEAGRLYLTTDDNYQYRWADGAYALLGTGPLAPAQSLAGGSPAAVPSVAAVAAALGSLPPPEVTRADVAAGLATKADLLNGKLPLSQLPDALLGQVRYKGTYLFGSNVVASGDAALHGQPLPASAAATQGWYLLAQDAGTLAGNEFNPGDWLISNGAAGWAKVDNTDAVTTVAGRTGAISLSKADVGLENADNTSDASKPASAAVLAALAAKANLVGGQVPAAELPLATATTVGALKPAPDSFTLAPDGTLRPLRYTDVTYAQLTALLTNSGLVPYTWYRLTDYQTVHLLNGTSVLNTAPLEPLLLQAAAPNALNPVGYSTTYPTDVVYYVTNNYDARLNGATKGGIVRRIDTKYTNDFDIDFRNVKVRRWLNAATGLYTESSNSNTYQDVPLFNAAGYGSGRITNNLCRLSTGQSAYSLLDIMVDGSSSFYNNELRYSTVTRLTVLSNSSFYGNFFANSIVSNSYFVSSSFLSNSFNAAYISGNALTASSQLDNNNASAGNITNNVLSGAFISNNFLFQNATIGGNNMTKSAISNNVLYANSDIRNNTLTRSATTGSISIESNILNFASVITGNTLKVVSSGISKNYLNNSFIASLTLAATFIQGNKLYNTTNPTFTTQGQFFVDGTVLLKTVNGLAPNAAGNLTTPDQTLPPTSITNTVASGAFSSGELAGTQPSGSLAGMRFCDATYRYEYQYGMSSTLVWVRTLKS